MTTTRPAEPVVPVRTCIGCRQRRPQPELVRLAVVDGQLAAGAGLPGRGAWLCRATVGECFEQAATGRRFGRALRAEIDPASFPGALAVLTALVTRDTTEGGGTGKVSPVAAR